MRDMRPSFGGLACAAAIISGALLGSACYSYDPSGACKVRCDEAAGAGACPAGLACNSGFCTSNAAEGEACLGTAEPDASPAPIDAASPDAAPSHKLIGLSGTDNNFCAWNDLGDLYCWGDDHYGQVTTNFTGPRLPTATTPVKIDLGTPHVWTKAAVGRLFTCGLTDGAIFCWGRNANRQLGNVADSTYLNEVEPPSGETWVDVTAGDAHTCARTDGDSVYCWGAAGTAELGTNPGNPGAIVAAPQLVDSGFVAGFDAGSSLSCALRPGDGAAFDAYCWGTAKYAEAAEVPNDDCGVQCQHYDPSAPRVAGLQAVSAGSGFACGLTADARVVCWGSNGVEQLGRSGAVLTASPTPIEPEFPVSAPSTWLDVSAGTAGACAVGSDATVYCWGGNNSFGERGTGTLGGVNYVPTKVDLDDQPAIDVEVGTFTACALLVSGEVRCWGSGSYGALGDGSTDFATAPRLVSKALAQDTVDAWTSVTAMQDGGCATGMVGVTQRVFCWGNNNAGQVNGTVAAPAIAYAPQRTPVAAGAVRAVASGDYHTCAIRDLATDDVMCWGSNNLFRLGTSDIQQHQTSPAFTLSVVPSDARLYAGGSETCAVTALIATGVKSTWCWGRGMYGPAVPTPRTEIDNLRTGSASDDDVRLSTAGACGRTSDGQVRCYGANDRGQLGRGDFAASSTLDPVLVNAVTLLPTASLISGGDGSHRCAIANDGAVDRVYCWGANDGAAADPDQPVEANLIYATPILEAPAAVDLATSTRNTCVAAGNTVTCWGGGRGLSEYVDGALGAPAPTPGFGEVSVALGTLTDIAVGDRHACGIWGGELYCWGSNLTGALGVPQVRQPAPVQVQVPL